MTNGVKTTNLTRQFAIDEVIGNVTTEGVASTVRIPFSALADQLAGTGTFVFGNTVYAATEALLDASTPPSDTAGGAVFADPDASRNGYYTQDGVGGWDWQRGFPDTVAVLENIGGTANAITADTAAGVNPADVQMIILPDPPGTNTSQTVTITLNGGSAENIKAAAGGNVALGDIIAGVGTAFFRFGTEWRQLFSSATGATFDHQGTWTAPTTYTEGQVVTGSNGNWYQLKAASSIGDDPVGSVTGEWLQILAAVAIPDGSIARNKLDSDLSASMPVSVIERGATADGVADDAAAIDAAQALGPLRFTPGTYRVGTNLEITESAVVEPGVLIVVADGVTLTLSGDVFAGAYKIFEVEGSGAIVADTSTSALSEIRAAWFDATYVGDAVIARGRYAAHGVLGNPGLVPGFDYVHVDGFMACRDTTQGTEGLAIGTYAAAAATMMRGNTFVGYSAGRGEQVEGLEFRSWTGENNTGIGSGALNDILSATGATALGAYALKEFETGNGMTAIGSQAGRLGTVGSDSVWIGTIAAYNAGTTGLAADNERSVAIGASALTNATQSYRNTAVGARAGYGLVTGQENTFIGHFAGVESATYGTVSDAIAIGNTAWTRVNDTITIGNSITETQAGRIRIVGASQTSCLISGIYGNTSVEAANVYIDSAGVLRRSTSSGEYKKDIEPLADEWADKVLELEPVYYRSACESDNPDWGWYGLIAEEAAKVDARFATWTRKPVLDEDGNLLSDENGHVLLEDNPTPNGVPYDRLVVSLLAVVRRHERTIAALEERIDALEGATRR